MRRLFDVGLILALVGACSGGRYAAPEGKPSLVFPAAIAEGEPRVEDAGAAEASAEAASAPALGAEVEPRPKMGSLPDPEPLRTERQWQYEFAYDGGTVSVKGVRAMIFAQPVVTARKMGRYAVELWIGRELIDRVRFDFPGTAADEPEPPGRRPVREAPRLGAAAKVVQTVLVPQSPRATRAVLVDRATGQTLELPWPPDRPLNGPVDAGAGD